MKKFARLLGIGGSEQSEQAQPALQNAEVITDHKNEVQQVAVSEIVPNPFQPRKTFNDESLQELAASINEYGVIQPLLVRKVANGYELIAGERRLRASKLAGLERVPVITKEIDDREMAELAMLENLQREDLHFLEEAQGFQQLIANFGFTQEELARRLGKNQSTIANKLRLLRLPPEIQATIVAENLTERHARSLLKVDDPELQQVVLQTIKERGLNVRQTEEFIDGLLADLAKNDKEPIPKQNIVKIIKDVRIFINTINNVVGEMKKAGLKIKMNQAQDDEFITISLRIPKRR